jgi:DNA polymerase-1
LVTRLKYLPDGGPRVENYLAKEITQLRCAIKSARGLDAISRSVDATKRWHDIYSVLSRATDTGRLVVDRAEPHTLRLSQIYAVVDGKSQIEVEHIEAAYAVWRYCEACALEIFGVEKLCREAQLVLDHLRGKGSDGATRTEIQNRVFHNHKTGSEIQSWLRSLSEKQLAWYREEKNDNGNLIERWFATKHSGTRASKPPSERAAKRPQKAPKSNEFAANSQRLRTGQASPRADLRTNSPNSPNSQERGEKEPALTAAAVTVTGEGDTENFIYPANSANSANSYREGASVKDRPIRNSCEFVANSYVYVAKNGEIARALGVLGCAPSLALDTETDGDTLRLVQISDGKNPPLILDAREADLRADLALLLKDKELIIQNAKFDLRVLKNAFGLEIPTSRIFDTYIASVLLTNTKVTEELKKHRRRNWHPNSLASIVRRVTGVNLDKTFQSADWSVDLTLPENAPRLEYAANDVRYLHPGRLHLQAELESHNLIPVYELERDLIPCINAMSESGLYVDRDAIDRLAAEARDLTAQREAVVLSLLNRKINLRSRKAQLLPALQALGLTVDGVPLSTTDKNVLPLVDQKDHPVIKAVLDWSTSNEEAKQLAQWPRHIDSDGLVRPQINQFGTVTHRFVYKEPNLQQVKKSQLRSIITAPSGHLIMRADFKTIELIIAAVHYNEANILGQVVKGVDLHKVTAAPMFRVSLDDVLGTQRDVAKTTNFSLLYGRALESYINACRIAGITMSSEELTRIYHDFDKAWPEMAKYRVQLAQQIARRTHPREVRSMYGRRICLDDSLSNREVRGALLNYAIQSSAADVLKLTMLNIWQASPKGVQLLASVHDEILFLLLPDQVKYAKGLLREAATDATRRVQKCDIPIQLEIGVGRNWWEAIQDKGNAQ